MVVRVDGVWRGKHRCVGLRKLCLEINIYIGLRRYPGLFFDESFPYAIVL